MYAVSRKYGIYYIYTLLCNVTVSMSNEMSMLLLRRV